MAAGFALLLFFSFGAMRMTGSSAVFSQIGGLFIAFGVTTLIASSYAKPDCPLKRQDRLAIGMLFIVLGIAGSLII